MNKKYELTDETINHYGVVLHRIKALRSFSDVEAGDLGGYIQSEDNLSHEGDCWISGNAIVKDEAKVFDNAIVCGNAIVRGNANIYNYAKVTDGVIIGSTINGDTLIDTHVYLKDNAYISSASDYFSINMNDIMATFYLSKDKDIYFFFFFHEYKLDDLNSYLKDLNNIAVFQMLV